MIAINMNKRKVFSLKQEQEKRTRIGCVATINPDKITTKMFEKKCPAAYAASIMSNNPSRTLTNTPPLIMSY